MDACGRTHTCLVSLKMHRCDSKLRSGSIWSAAATVDMVVRPSSHGDLPGEGSLLACESRGASWTRRSSTGQSPDIRTLPGTAPILGPSRYLDSRHLLEAGYCCRSGEGR